LKLTSNIIFREEKMMKFRKRTTVLLPLFILGIFSIFFAMGAVSCNGGTDTPNPAKVAVDATDLDTFDPKVIEVDAGTIVTWTNIDTDDHTVIMDPLDPIGGGPNSDTALSHNIAPGAKFVWMVPETAVAGTRWYYHCRIHGAPGDGSSYGTGMVGVIIVK
jgi:plastocyanin